MQTPDIFLSFQSEWSAAVFFIPNPALPVAVSFQKQSLFSVCFWYLEILIFFFFFSRNPLLFFILLCQKNRVHQQLHEHLQDAMSFLKDVCEVLYYRWSLSSLHVPYVSPHFYFLSLVLADVHDPHSEMQFI